MDLQLASKLKIINIKPNKNMKSKNTPAVRFHIIKKILKLKKIMTILKQLSIPF